MLRTEGIVIREMNYRDTSKIITLFTKKRGKLSIMARGAHSPKSRLIGVSQIFTLSDFQLTQGRNFYYISEFDIEDSFYSIREDIERVIYGYYMLELVDKTLPLEQENENIYELFKKGLEVLSKLEDNFLEFIVAYELKYISFLGYRPFLTACVNCNKKEFKDIKFSANKGGLICQDCFSQDRFARNIDSKVVNLLNEALYIKLENINQLDYGLETVKLCHKILVDYILISSDRKEFNSLKILDSLRHTK